MRETLLVLAGGFGTRLRSLVSDVPKPLAPVEGIPFLQYLILNWKRQGIKSIVLLIHYESEKIKNLVLSMDASGLLAGVEVRVVVENSPLGTGGSVFNALNDLNIKDNFLVANADTWLSGGLQAVVDAGPYSIGAKKVCDVGRYGELDIKDGNVEAFDEKLGGSRSGWINAGIYHLNADIFAKYKLGDSFSLEKTVLPDIVKSRQLRVVKLEADFIDIGVPKDYLTFCDWVKKGRVNEI
jgi:D-glycero-alpha-D-manno-heptose 1-phosphate guanylyltransferase